MNDDKDQLSEQLNQSLEKISKEIETILSNLETMGSDSDNNDISKILNDTKKKIKAISISEPLNENELSKEIRSLGKINDNISQKVKSQYEENPYPRWRYMRFLGNQKIFYKQAINNEIAPNKINKNINLNEPLEYLLIDVFRFLIPQSSL